MDLNEKGANHDSRTTILVLLLIFWKGLILDVALALDGQPQRLYERRQKPDDDSRGNGYLRTVQVETWGVHWYTLRVLVVVGCKWWWTMSINDRRPCSIRDATKCLNHLDRFHSPSAPDVSLS